MIAALAWKLARACLLAWWGAASLFVAITIAEVTSGAFPARVLDQLVLSRFPFYYATSGVLIGTAAVAAIVAATTQRPVGWRWLPLIGLLLAVIVLCVDYALVYRPLREMLLPLGSPRPQQFHALHVWTERLNFVLWLLVGAIGWTMNFVDAQSPIAAGNTAAESKASR